MHGLGHNTLQKYKKTEENPLFSMYKLMRDLKIE